MDIRKLEYFLAIAEEGQITKAAKRLHIAQPPLSQQLKLLEAELGIQLIERGGSRKVKLTDAGQALHNRAREILELIDQTVREIRDLSEGLQGTLSIGVSTSWGAILLLERIRRFHELYPEINFRVWEGEGYNIEEFITNGIVEIAITRSPANSATYASISLPDEPAVAAFAPKWDFGIPANYVRLVDLADKPLIFHHKHEIVLKHCHRLGIEPRILCRHTDTRTMLAWANAGLGVAIVHKSADLLSSGNLIFREIIEPPLRTSTISVVWMRNRHLSRPARLFIEMFS